MTTDTQAAPSAVLKAQPESPAQSASPSEPASTPKETSDKPSFATKLKHVLLKIIDVTALGFLEPIVRLCYGEEPQVQIKKIGKFIALPLVAFVLFIALWAVLAPNLKTKYGALPTPTEVWAGAVSAFTFHDREQAKYAAYLLTGDQRVELNEQATAEVTRLNELAAAADQAVLDAREAEKTQKDARKVPLEAQLEELKQTLKDGKAERKEQLATLAAALSSEADRLAYSKAYADNKTWEDDQKSLQNDIKAQLKLIDDEKTPAVLAALAEQTRVAEEKNFFNNLAELTGDRNREIKVGALAAKLDEYQATYAAATGADAAKLAGRIFSTNSRLPDLQASIYAKPWTLPMQIVRSIVTVFVGFFIGVAIAIPIGVLCGLSTTFMAVMTPFIALFKPVSPIVWLLVLWIIVGGFIPDPDNSPTLAFLNNLTNGILYFIPMVNGIIEDIDINPALIASALTVAMCSLWATMVNTALGVASVDKDHLNVAKVLRLGFWARLRKIILPSTLPLMFAGMRISLGIGWMVLIAAELLASSEGLGKYVNDMFQNGNTDSFSKIMAMVFVVGIIGLILDRIMIVFQRLVSFEGSVAAV